MQWMTCIGQPPAPASLQWLVGPAVIVVAPAWHFPPFGYFGYPSPPPPGPASRLDLMPPPSLALRTSWSPPRVPHGDYPQEVDRDDDGEMRYKIDEILEPADPLVAAIHHWARLTSRWCKADPSLAKLFEKPRWVESIRSYLGHFLRLKGLRTDAVMAHARLYFPDFSEGEVIYRLPCDLPTTSSKPQKEFLCRLLLDFIRVDPAVCDLMIAAGFEQAREWGCLRRFEQLMAQELKATPAVLKFLKAQAASILAEAQGNRCNPLVEPATDLDHV